MRLKENTRLVLIEREVVGQSEVLIRVALQMFHGENAGAGTQETGEDDEEEQEDEEMEQEPTEQVGKERGKGPALIGPVDDRPDSLKNRDQGSQRTAGQGQDDITIPMPAVGPFSRPSRKEDSTEIRKTDSFQFQQTIQPWPT